LFSLFKCRKKHFFQNKKQGRIYPQATRLLVEPQGKLISKTANVIEVDVVGGEASVRCEHTPKNLGGLTYWRVLWIRGDQRLGARLEIKLIGMRPVGLLKRANTSG
jgi:hypothetical protein